MSTIVRGTIQSWTSCSKTCGTGTQTKSFVVTKSEANGGNCVNRGSVLSQPCNTTPCPENCEGHWGDYGAILKTCGGGTQTRNFVVTKNELYGGICPNRDGSETRSCNSNPCPRDCSGYWSSWSSCSKKLVEVVHRLVILLLELQRHMEVFVLIKVNVKPVSVTQHRVLRIVRVIGLHGVLVVKIVVGELKREVLLVSKK